MAVEAPDKEERENPVRNFVGGTSGDHKIKWVTGIDPNGHKHKLNADNASDWQSRGPAWRVAGPWHDPNEVEVEETVDETEEETEDTAEEEEDAAPPGGDRSENEALQKLHAMREEATKLGVTVNEQWGLKRLQREIDGAKLRQKNG